MSWRARVILTVTVCACVFLFLGVKFAQTLGPVVARHL